MWGRGIVLVSFALAVLGSTIKCPKRKTSPIREILCYTSTLDARLLADSICSCTTLVHQSHDVRNLSISDIADLRKSLNETHPSLQFIISINDAAKTFVTSATLRQETIALIIDVVKEVDGVELNVTAGSKERLYNFVKSLKNEMTRKFYDKRIFMVLPSKPEDLVKHFDLKELAKYVDLFTLPTDYLTDNDEAFVTFHPSRLMGLFDMLNTDNLVDLIHGLGVPKWKIIISLPANAYKFILKDEDENAPRSQTTEKEPVPIDRKQLCKTMNNGEWTVERDEDLTAPYAFQNKTWISFEDKISVAIKSKYALLRDLAGLAVRNVENDTKTTCEEPLTREIYHSFTKFKRKSRQAVLNALEDELRQIQFSYPNQAKTSNYRVVRVMDTEGHVRAVRENTQTEFICRRQGYFVHPKSCNRFYRCVKFNQEIEDYTVFEFDCPAGLSFDERTEVCVWPGSLPQGSPCPGSSEIAPVTQKRFECPYEPGYYADPQNCRWFFACMDLGESKLMAFEFRCPYGLVFDERKLACEWPWLVPACSNSGFGYTRTEYDYGGYTGSSIGTGGYITGSLPRYSVTTGRDYSDVSYSKTIGADIYKTSRANYPGYTTGHINGNIGVSTSAPGTISGHVGLSDAANVDYSESIQGYKGSFSFPTYPELNSGSISSGTIATVGGNTRYPIPSSEITSNRHTGPTGIDVEHRGYSGQVNTGYTSTESLDKISTGIPTGISDSTFREYSATMSKSHLTGEGTIYSGIPTSSYSGFGNVVESSGGVNDTKSIIEGINYIKTPETNYFGSTVLPGSSPDVHLGFIGPKYIGSTNLYTESKRVNTDDYISSSINLNSEDSTSAGYFPGINFINDASKPEFATSGISVISEHIGTTTADNSHFVSGNTQYSGPTDTSSIGIKYKNEEKYPVSGFIEPDKPIYPSVGTIESEVKGYTGTGTYGVSITNNYGSSVQPGIIVSTTSKPYISQSEITYQDTNGNGAFTKGSTNYPSSASSEGLSTSHYGNQLNKGHDIVTFNSAYDINKYSENDIPDYRPTSAAFPESFVPAKRKESVGSIIYGSTLSGVQVSTTPVPKYSSTKTSVFTPSGFTKTGPTKTGITTAILGGGGSYSVSTSDRRPILKPENIGEKAFEGNVVGYTKTSSTGNVAGLSSTLIPFGFSSTVAPADRINLQSTISGYSYPKPNVNFENNGASFVSPTLPTESNLYVTTPAPLSNVEIYNESSDRIGTFGLKIPTISTTNLQVPTVTPIERITEYPEIYKTTLFKPKIPVFVSTVRPIVDTGYKTDVNPTNIPVSISNDKFTQQRGSSQTSSISTSNIGLTTLFGRTGSNGQKDYSSFQTTSSSPVLEYLPEKSSKPDVILSISKYNIPTVRPESEVTFKKHAFDVTYKGPSSDLSSTTFRPSDIYYSNERSSTTSSLGTTYNSDSQTNLGISRNEIDKLITNYGRGTIKYTPNFAVTPSSLATSSYEVTTKSPEGKGKVIVKWSDLHPLLLGKLGAECTCKADPFATLRGPGKKLIASSKGKVDLDNYDESEIYVDLEKDDSFEENDYITNYDDFSPQPFKISQPKTTSITASSLPSSSYLPVPSTTISTRNIVPAIDIRSGTSEESDIPSRSSGFRINLRTGKKLKNIGSSPNSIVSDQEDADQIIVGANDCARSGLFRHPNFCNKFYACHWDQWKKKFTLHVFNCPIHLTFDTNASACNWPSKGPACQAGNLLI